MNKKDSIYLKEHGMLFMRNNLGYFEPIAYNLKEDKDGNFTGTEIKKGNVIYDYIKFVKYAAGTRDKKTGKKMMNGYLDIYQWVMSIYSITMALNFKSEDLMVAISRQANL